MASTGGGGMGMGGGPDSAPGGSSSSSGTGNAPGEGMGAGAFDGGGGASKDTSTIEGFMEAIARAIGHKSVSVDQESIDNMNEEAANNRAIAAAVEARDRTQREAREQEERQAMMDDIDAMQNKTNFATPAPAVKAVDLDTYDAKFASPHNMVDETETEKEYGPTFSGMTSPFGIDESQLDDPTDDSPAYDPDAVNRQVYGAPQDLDDPQGTEEGLDAEQEARDAQNISRQKQEQEIDKSYYDSHTIDRQKQANMKAIQDRFGFSPGNPHMDVNLDSPSREALAKDPKMRDPVYRDLAFNFIDNVMDQGPKNSTLENIIGYINKAFNPAFGLGTIAKAILDSLGFNVNPNLGQRALAAATTAYEGGIP